MTARTFPHPKQPIFPLQFSAEFSPLEIGKVKAAKFTCDSIQFPRENLSRIYSAVVNGTFHQIMQHPDFQVCAGKKAIGECGFRDGELYECACPGASRLLVPEIRETYENDCVETILNSFPLNYKKEGFLFKMALFAPGGLLTERNMLFKFFEKFRERGGSGTLRLFLIDLDYKEAISKGEPTPIHRQFIDDLSAMCPRGLTVEGYVFGDSAEYEQVSRIDSKFTHDFICGADMEGGEVAAYKTAKVAAGIIHQGACYLLRKTADPCETEICTKIDSNGNGLSGSCKKIRKIEERKSTDNTLLYVAAAIAIGICFAGIFYYCSPSKKKTAQSNKGSLN